MRSGDGAEAVRYVWMADGRGGGYDVAGVVTDRRVPPGQYFLLSPRALRRFQLGEGNREGDTMMDERASATRSESEPANRIDAAFDRVKRADHGQGAGGTSGDSNGPRPGDYATIGDALRWLRNGQRVTRQGWNGRGQYLELQRPDIGSHMTRPYIFITTVQGDRVPWVASQTDLLANDWLIVYEVRGTTTADGVVYVDGQPHVRTKTGT